MPVSLVRRVVSQAFRTRRLSSCRGRLRVVPVNVGQCNAVQPFLHACLLWYCTTCGEYAVYVMLDQGQY